MEEGNNYELYVNKFEYIDEIEKIAEKYKNLN